MFSVDVFPTLSACVNAQEVLEISPQKIVSPSRWSQRHRADFMPTTVCLLMYGSRGLRSTSLFLQRVPLIPVLVCSLSNVIQSRPTGVHEWLRVAAIETAVTERDYLCFHNGPFQHHRFGPHGDADLWKHWKALTTRSTLLTRRASTA